MSRIADDRLPITEGARVLARRIELAPALLVDVAAAALPDLGLATGLPRRFVTTGLGASAGHARFLAHVLDEIAGVPARFVETSALAAGPPAGAGDDALVVFSQGLSPNARFALAHPSAWRRLWLVTAAHRAEAGARDPDTKARWIAALRAAGAVLVGLPGGDEGGMLLRVGGPLAGYAVALRLAAAVAHARGDAEAAARLEPDPARIVPALATARLRAQASWEGCGGVPAETALVLLTSGALTPLAAPFAAKLQEGWLAPAPPVVDLLALAHGPLQQTYPLAATFVALTRPGDPGGADEAELLALLERDLAPDRHRLLRFEATLPFPHAIFEHEQMTNELLLCGVEARGLDPTHWPLQAPEPALYRHAPASPDPAARADSPHREAAPLAAPDERPRRLDALTWPEVEALVAGGVRTAVIALGATEQHGPHLALGADAWIAEALAERFCARVPEALLAAVLPLGCSPEHLAFPGTLSLRAETLEATLHDLLDSLAAHGFERAFVFTAHGGNVAWLRAAAPRLARSHPGLRLALYADLGAIAAVQHEVARRFGVSAEEAGHHAGELETSILLALRPGAVRRERLAPGLAAPAGDAQALFYPSLRERAPEGVVGDPRRADAARAAAYLDAWADALVAAYRAEKKVANTKGTNSP